MTSIDDLHTDTLSLLDLDSLCALKNASKQTKQAAADALREQLRRYTLNADQFCFLHRHIPSLRATADYVFDRKFEPQYLQLRPVADAFNAYAVATNNLGAFPPLSDAFYASRQQLWDAIHHVSLVTTQVVPVTFATLNTIFSCHQITFWISYVNDQYETVLRQIQVGTNPTIIRRMFPTSNIANANNPPLQPRQSLLDAFDWYNTQAAVYNDANPTRRPLPPL